MSKAASKSSRPIFVLLRHIAAIAILPVTVALVVPAWVARRYHMALKFAGSSGAVTLQMIGLFAMAFGLLLFLASLRRFVIEGQGTLAPWDPPPEFVASGPYRFVRNPMISGVVFMLCGEALLLLSLPNALWAAFCVVLNLIYIPLVEEPQLKRRFGASYDLYCRNVPRFIPRLIRWQPTK